MLPSFSEVGACCHQLATQFPFQVFYPANGTYTSLQRDYWARQEAVLAPTCILTPQSSSDVSTAVKLLVRDPMCHFAIKGGGHSPNAGSANIHHGITVDMSLMNSVSLNADQSIAQIGSGAKWGDVFDHLDSVSGLAVAGGENGNVGVGGLLLGGGLSQFGPRVGWSCDRLVNAELVDASGNIINANRTAHPDLWKALKGGGNNFGIVTRYDLATFPQGDVWSGTVINDISYRSEAFEAFVQIANASDYDRFAFPATELIYSSGKWSVEHVLAYTKPVNSTPKVFKRILDIPRGKPGEFKLTNLSTLANEGSELPTLNIALRTGTYTVDVEMLERLFTFTNATMHHLRLNGTLCCSLVYQPLPAIWMEHADKNGGNSLGTTPQQGNAFLVMLTVKWSEPGVDTFVQNALDKLQDDIDTFAISKGLKQGLSFMNYAGSNQNPLASYGKSNLKFLKEMAQKYDPHGVFQSQVPGGFKLRIAE